MPSSKITKGYKLVRLRKNGTLGPLFINARQVMPIGRWMKAEAHRRKGFAFRPGWHASPTPKAPHLSEKGRVWVTVQLKGVTLLQRPAAQGGTWYLAKQMKITGMYRKPEEGGQP
jgi:hypothetical protein